MILAIAEHEERINKMMQAAREKPSAWQLMSMKLADTAQPIGKYTKEIVTAYLNVEGALIAVDERRLIALVQLEDIDAFARIKNLWQQKFASAFPRVTIRQVNSDLLEKIDTYYISRTSAPGERDFYKKRIGRADNTFLVIDDDMFIRHMMKEKLKKHAAVYDADNGKDALALYKEHNPDIVFLDIHMPQKSGMEVINDILNLDMDAYIVLLSADAIKENILGAIEKGAVGFLSKPPSPEKLAIYIQHCTTYSRKE